MDATYPDFEPDYFDLIVVNNTLGNLCKPKLALSAWRDILRPGGFIIILDGNYCLYRCDEDYGVKHEHYLAITGKTEDLNIPQVQSIDFEPLGEIIKDFEQNRHERPAWDVGLLMNLGFGEIKVGPMDAEVFTRVCEYGEKKVVTRFGVMARKILDTSFQYRVERVTAPNPTVSLEDRSAHIDCDAVDAIANKVRCKIIYNLMNGPMNVKEITSKLSISRYTVMYHLDMLKKAGLVKCERKGRSTVYQLTDHSKIANLMFDLETIHPDVFM